MLTESADRGLLHMVINFLTPCLILDRVLPNNIFADSRNLIYPPLLGYGTIAAGIAVAYAVGWLPSRLTALDTPKKVGTFAACVGLLNYGFVPIPLVQLLFGDNDPTMSVLFVQNLGVEFALWTVGLSMIQGKISRNSWKHAINGPTVAILIAIPLNLVLHNGIIPKQVIDGLQHLTFVKEAVHLLGLTAIPMSMLLIGATISDNFRLARYRIHFWNAAKISFWSCLIRILILPVFGLCIAVYLPCSIELKRVLVLHSAMSSAIFPIVMTKHYGGDQETALDAVLSNSLISIISVPVWIAVGLKLING